MRNHRPFGLILALFLTLGVIYSVVNPLFEAPDEVWHYEYVRWLAEGHGLPRPEQVGSAPWHQEGSQPPLYYLLAAALTWPIPTDNAGQVIRYNPHAAVGQPDSFGNKNIIVHGRADAWPWRGVALAAHVVRFFSLLLAAVTVLATYGTALAIFPGRRELAALAAGLVAFNPQFLFLSAAVNNDNLVIATSAAGVWLCVHLLGCRQPLSATSGNEAKPALTAGVHSLPSAWPGCPTLLQLLLLGLLVGLAGLAKLSGLALAGLAGLTLLMMALRRGSLRELIGWGLAVAVAALAVAGWWYWRNWRLYGDPLGLQAMFEVLPPRAEPPGLAELLARAEGVWRSAWAVFGWFNVPADGWLYELYSALSLAGLAGLLVVWPSRWVFAGIRDEGKRKGDNGVGRRKRGKLALSVTLSSSHLITLSQLILLLVWILMVVLALLNWARMCYPQGRLLFPALSAAAVLLSLGISGWLPRVLRGPAAAVLVIGLLALAALAPIRWIAPAYAAPQLLEPKASLPNPLAADFGGQARLLGYQVENPEVRPGQQLYLTLYWQALSPMDHDYSVFVHLSDEYGIVQAQRDSYPASGALATSDWPLQAIIPDRHAVEIPETAPAPARLRVDVGLYDFATGQRLLVGQADHWTLGYVALLPRPGVGGLPNPIFVNFDNQIALVGFDFDRRVLRGGETLEVTLWWEALAVPRMDYVAFVHLVLPPEAVWAQQDQMPQAGRAPTSTWQPGQRIEDHYRLTLPAKAPAGVYFVEIGLYDPATLDRLKVNFSDKGVVLGQVKVEG